jgi:hypothetical protein
MTRVRSFGRRADNQLLAQLRTHESSYADSAPRRAERQAQIGRSRSGERISVFAVGQWPVGWNSRLAGHQTILPHPSPLPLGEGELYPVSQKIEQWDFPDSHWNKSKHTAAVPSPSGELGWESLTAFIAGRRSFMPLEKNEMCASAAQARATHLMACAYQPQRDQSLTMRRE